MKLVYQHLTVATDTCVLVWPFVSMATAFKGTVSAHRQAAVLNLASGTVVNCEVLDPGVWATTTTTDCRHDFEFLCRSNCLTTSYSTA